MSSGERTALLPKPAVEEESGDTTVPPRLRRAPSRRSAAGGDSTGRLGGILLNRILVVIALCGVVVASLFFQHSMGDLSAALQTEHSKVEDLQKILMQHEQVIERFNTSITNSDVVKRLSTLEDNLATTTKSLNHKLETVQADITQQLDTTIQQLSETVDKAEKEISDEVEMVKKDVEQYVIKTQDQFSMENSFMVYQLAGTFTLLSCLISMWHMTAHLRRLNQPDVQRKILAILWMSPLYAVTSWFSLVFHSAEGYLAIIKDGYEAYIIYQFLSFCIAVLGKGDRNVVVDLLARRADHLTPPFRLFGCCAYVCGCCKPDPYENSRALADAILLQCQLFAMQFVLFRPLTTTAIVVLQKLDYYGAGDGPTDYRAPQFYVTIVQNLSIFVAFTGLLKFYHAVDKDLAWCRPFAKFLCIKGVVFMTFWQGLAISILAQTTDVGGEDTEEWAKSAQNFLICLEMLLFSIAHFYCFPTEEWEEGYKLKHSQGQFGDSIALGDFLQDVKLILLSNNKTKKKKSPSKQRQTPTIPEGTAEDDDTHVEDEEEETAGENEADVERLQPQEVPSPERKLAQGDSDAGGVSSADSSFEMDDEKFVARALEQSLGLLGDDPDIAEAKQRLLESGILSPEFFQGLSDDDAMPGEMSSDEEEESEDEENVGIEGAPTNEFEEAEETDGAVEKGDGDEEGDVVDSTTDRETNVEVAAGAESEAMQTADDTEGDSIRVPGEDHDRLEVEPVNGDTTNAENAENKGSEGTTERTGLLSSTRINGSSPLRPSIFTTVASVAAAEEERELGDQPIFLV